MSSTSASGGADRGGGARARLPGPSSWLVASCMVMIAASLAAVIYLRFDVALAEAGWIGFAALMLMVLAEFFSARRRERAAVEAQLNEVEAVANQLSRDVGRIEHQFGALEAALRRRIEDGLEARLAEVRTELQALEAGVGEINARVGELERSRADVRRPTEPETAPQSRPAADDDAVLETVRRAVSDNRIEVFLQPVVQLPQRRVRYYEALTRLRDEDGGIILPGDYMPVAETAGLMPLIDNILLFRCVKILRRMVRRMPELAIFCNLSARSLVDSRFFPQFIEFMESNRELAGSLIFEFPQGVVEGLGPIEHAGLDVLAELGFRFSVDHVSHLEIDGAAYASRRVRFVKADARTLLDPPPGGSIHVVDLARLLARSGIELVAGRVETEAELVDLLDYGIGLGQGHLFSPPRPVRPEFLGEAAQGADWADAS